MRKTRSFAFLLATIILLFSPLTAFAENPPSVAAKGAIAMDYETGKILYEKDMNTPRSVASMTKVMTSLLVYDAIADGRIKSDTLIPITREARNLIPDDPCGQYVRYGQQETVYDLLSVYLIVSSSPAGIALAQYLEGSVLNFVAKMNEKAKELGIDAHYNDPNGLKPNKVTPLAQAKLIRHFIQRYPEVLLITKRKSVNFSGRTYPANNRFYKHFAWYDGGVDGFKSGTMPFAGYCFSATAKRGDNRMITVVINSSGMNERYRDSIKLLDYGFSQYPLGYETSDWAKDIPVLSEAKGFNTAKLQGKSEFEGQEPLTRGEFAAMLAKTLELDWTADPIPFTDVEEGAWYSEWVRRAAVHDLVEGYGDGIFKPDTLLSREEMATMLQNALKLKDNGVVITFVDQEDIGDVFIDAVLRMAQYGILEGTPQGEFLPKDTATREESAKMLLNLLDAMDEGKLICGEEEFVDAPDKWDEKERSEEKENISTEEDIPKKTKGKIVQYIDGEVIIIEKK